MTSGSTGRWLLKLFDLPAVTVFRIWGLSSRFFRDEWRLMELRLPCPLMEHLSDPSLGRLWLMMGWEDGRQLGPGEAESDRELLSPWLSLRNVFRMLPDSGRFLCLQLQTKRAMWPGSPELWWSLDMWEGRWWYPGTSGRRGCPLLSFPSVCFPATPKLGKGEMHTYLVVLGFVFSRCKVLSGKMLIKWKFLTGDRFVEKPIPLPAFEQKPKDAGKRRILTITKEVGYCWEEELNFLNFSMFLSPVTRL